MIQDEFKTAEQMRSESTLPMKAFEMLLYWQMDRIQEANDKGLNHCMMLDRIPYMGINYDFRLKMKRFLEAKGYEVRSFAGYRDGKWNDNPELYW